MVQLRSWMIPVEACPGTFVALKGACGKTTTTLETPGSGFIGFADNQSKNEILQHIEALPPSPVCNQNAITPKSNLAWTLFCSLLKAILAA